MYPADPQLRKPEFVQAQGSDTGLFEKIDVNFNQSQAETFLLYLRDGEYIDHSTAQVVVCH